MIFLILYFLISIVLVVLVDISLKLNRNFTKTNNSILSVKLETLTSLDNQRHLLNETIRDFTAHVEKSYIRSELIPEPVDQNLYSSCLEVVISGQKRLEKAHKTMTDEQFIEAMNRVIFDIRTGSEKMLKESLLATFKWCKSKSRKHFFHSNLSGMCAIGSRKLFRDLKKNGIISRLCVSDNGDDGYHVFVIAKDYVLDPTATQYGCKGPRMFKIKESKHPYAFDAIFDSEKSLISYQKDVLQCAEDEIRLL